MSYNLTDQEFLKIVREKLGFLEEERFGYYKSLKLRTIVRNVAHFIMLSIMLYWLYDLFSTHGFDVEGYDQKTKEYMGYSIMGFGIPGIIFGIGLSIFAERPQVNYKKNFKSRVMPELAKILGGFDYKYQAHIDMWQLKQSKIIPPHEKMKCTDVFRGTYKGVNIEFAELYLYNEYKNKKGRDLRVCKFQGFYVWLDVVHTKFNGHTVLNNDAGKFLGVYKDGIVGLSKAGMADPKFEKIFDVLTNDQVEARYLLDPVMLEKITKLYHDFDGNGLSAAFYDSKLLIMISSGHDHFETEELKIPIFDAHSLLQIKHDIDNVTSIIDKLSLYNPDYKESEMPSNASAEECEAQGDSEETEQKDENISEHNYSF